MRKRIAAWYPWVVGLLGLAILGGRLLVHRDAFTGLLRGEYLALLVLAAVFELTRMPLRCGLAGGFGSTAVVVALILGGEIPAQFVSLGPLVHLAKRGRARKAFFNTGVYIISAAAGATAASLAGYPVRDPLSGLNMTGPMIFISVHFIVNSILAGLYSILVVSCRRAVDHLYNFWMSALYVCMSTALGVMAAISHRTFGAISLYFMCFSFSALAFLMNMGMRMASNREALTELYKAASSINEALTLKEVFERAHSFTRGQLHQDFAWLSLPTGDDRDGPTIAYTSLENGVDLGQATAHVSSLNTTEVASEPGGQLVWTRDRHSSQGYFGWVAVTALHLGKQHLGDFGVASLSANQEVSPEKLQLLAVLSSHLALAVDNALKFERATMLAFTDALTGLYNYRQFQNLFREAIARAEKSGSEVSLIYIDLDYFRNVNNTYGHQVGDEALKGIAGVIRSSCRDKDLVCRPGGDEFTVVLPGVSKDRARVVASRIQEHLQAIKLDVGLSEPLLSAIGASVGVSTYPEDGSDVDSLVRKADADMYSSKVEVSRGGTG